MRTNYNLMSVLLLGLIGVLTITIQHAAAETIRFASGERQTRLVELYTSEGCSSCPPADRWFSQLGDDDGLWTEFVPLAFHVTYWNYLGWEDRFSNKAFDHRQRDRASVAGAVVYTPGVFVDGQEYRRWRVLRSAPARRSSATAGRLNVEVNGEHVKASFSASSKHEQLHVEVASLAGGLDTAVRAGENRGRSLQHDFVVTTLEKHAMTNTGEQWEARFRLPEAALDQQPALAVWVVDDRGLPLQATGGWLDSMQNTVTWIR